MRELFTWEQAESLLKAVEAADLEFKGAVPDISDLEAAKDVAALAHRGKTESQWIPVRV